MVLVALLPFTQLMDNHTQWTSLALILLSANWLFTNNYPEKLRLLKQQPDIYWLIAPFALAGISLLWTNNWDEGLRILTLRLGIIAFPLIIFTTVYSEKNTQNTLRTLLISSTLAMLFTFRNGFGMLNDLMNLRLHTEDFTLMHRVYISLLLNFVILGLAEYLLANRKGLVIHGKTNCAMFSAWIKCCFNY